MVKLKDVPGALKTWEIRENDSLLEKAVGSIYNQCREAQGEVDLTLDRENLAKILHSQDGINSKQDKIDLAWKICKEKEYYLKHADAIIANLPTLLKAGK